MSSGAPGRSTIRFRFPRIAGLFTDGDASIRAAALKGLLVIDSNNTDYYIKTALNDTDFVVSSIAVEKIKEDKLTGYLTTLQTMMSRGDEIDRDLRRSLVDAAASFLRVNKNDSVSQDILVAGMLDDNYVVRRDAAEVYEELFGQDVEFPKTKREKKNDES